MYLALCDALRYIYTVDVQKKERWLMFNTIADTYDKANRWITFGCDILWRKAVVAAIPNTAKTLLDIASGTMDVAIAAASQHPNLSAITAMDMAQDMLHIGEQKCKQKNIDIIQPLVADVHNIPLNTAAMDAITVSFGIRNFEHLDTAFTEMHRVLNTNGHLVILETCQPQSKLLRYFNYLYLKCWVQWVGKTFTKDPSAYTYLMNTIKTFHSPSTLKQKLLNAGFQHVDISFHMLQSVQIIHAHK